MSERFAASPELHTLTPDEGLRARGVGPRLVALAATVALSTVVARPVHAEMIIKRPGNHPRYAVELEPHLALDPGGGGAFGPGVRGTFVVVDDGFIKSINNSVGVGVGLDLLFYDDGRCGRRSRDCGGAGAIVPLVMQWNFFLHPRWSVFGEPGVNLHFGGRHDDARLSWFTVYGGGRFHFSDAVTLTLRAGAPLLHGAALSVGASFLL